MEFTKIAVIGAGVMGTDVAFDLAANGHNVILKDVNNNALQAARNKICGDFRGLQMMKPELQELTLEYVFSKITFTNSYEDFGETRFVIENIPEDWQLKSNLYKELREVFDPLTVYAVNTSCIPITRIAALMPDPSLLLGMHFMNPVPLKKLVEVVKGVHTSEQTIAQAKKLLKSLKKTCVVVNDSPGFVANRLSHLFINEAAFLLQEQVASPREIDRVFKEGYGHAMGPLETADLIGLDTVVNSLKILYESYEDPKFRCCTLLKRMVEAGFHGKKSGKGFYEY